MIQLLISIYIISVLIIIAFVRLSSIQKLDEFEDLVGYQTIAAIVFYTLPLTAIPLFIDWNFNNVKSNKLGKNEK